jgi:hypothetical protein
MEKDVVDIEREIGRKCKKMLETAREREKV